MWLRKGFLSRGAPKVLAGAACCSTPVSSTAASGGWALLRGSPSLAPLAPLAPNCPFALRGQEPESGGHEVGLEDRDAVLVPLALYVHAAQVHYPREPGPLVGEVIEALEPPLPAHDPGGAR